MIIDGFLIKLLATNQIPKLLIENVLNCIFSSGINAWNNSRTFCHEAQWLSNSVATTPRIDFPVKTQWH